jgi:hypothetical protein
VNEDPVIPAGFEIYRKQRAQRPREPFARLTAQGIITLNVAAYGLLGEPPAVTLLWSAADRVVGLRPASSSELDAFRVRLAGASSGRVISARSFFLWAGIKGDGTRRPLVMEDGVGCIRLGADDAADPPGRQPGTGKD